MTPSDATAFAPANAAQSAAHEFAARWLQNAPALAVAQRFAANPAHWLAATVLLEELMQAMFSLSNLTLAHAKLCWWCEEASAWSGNAARHPLTRLLAQNTQASAAQAHAFTPLCEAALFWLELPSADTEAQRGAQLSAFAHAASNWLGAGDTEAIWAQLARLRQLAAHAKPDRYGPALCARATLAEYQLKSAQLADRVAAAPYLKTQLNAIAAALRRAVQQNRGTQAPSGTRAYAALHADAAARWAKLPPAQMFEPKPPGLLAVFSAWRGAR